MVEYKKGLEKYKLIYLPLLVLGLVGIVVSGSWDYISSTPPEKISFGYWQIAGVISGFALLIAGVVLLLMVKPKKEEKEKEVS